MKNVGKSISFKLITVILLVSSCITFVITLVQLSLDYNEELSTVEKTFALIQSGSGLTIAKAVWDISESTLEIAASGIMTLPHVIYVEVQDEQRKLLSIGPEPTKKFVMRDFPLFAPGAAKQRIGTLKAAIDMGPIYEKLARKIVIIFFSQLLKTLLVSAILYFFIIRSMLIKHLTYIAAHLRSFELGKPTPPLRLQRPAPRPGHEDEFDLLTSLVNEMQKSLNHSYGEIQELNANLRQKVVEVQNSSQAKSLFLANMSHELRTPMHGILSFANFGQTKIDTVSREKLKTYFDEIHDSGTKLMNLLADLLDLSQLESGKAEYTFSKCSFHDMAAQVRVEMQESARQAGLAIEIAGQAEGLADHEKIMRIFRNVVSNAIKFSNPNTTIQIQLEKHDNGFVRCAISNQGVGIPENELDAIFDKFVQSSKTRTTAGGTGLGLAICREIIQQHQGKIWAESASGQTRFVFELPPFSI